MTGSTQLRDHCSSRPPRRGACVVQGEEEAVAAGTGAASGAAQSLEECGDGAGGVELDDPVQVAHVDAEFQRAGRDDHTVPCLGERRFGPPAFVHGQ